MEGKYWEKEWTCGHEGKDGHFKWEVGGEEWTRVSERNRAFEGKMGTLLQRSGQAFFIYILSVVRVI